MQLPLVLCISGASGVICGVEMLKMLQYLGQPRHLILSEAGARNLATETDYTMEQVKAMATQVYEVDDVGAPVASGSFRCRGMIVAPCTIKTLSAIANSFNYNLPIRAADVTLKEKRPLVLMVRETLPAQGVSGTHDQGRWPGSADTAAGAGLLSPTQDHQGYDPPEHRQGIGPLRH